MRTVFSKHFKVYIAVILIPVVLWCAIYSVLDDPADNEKFSILYVGDGLDCEGLSDFVSDVLAHAELRSVSVDSTTVPDGLYYEYLQTRCYDYDLIIISEENMRTGVGRVVFEREIMFEKYGELLPAGELYYENAGGADLPFGYASGAGCGDALSRYLEAGEVCYVFISPRSVNFGGINGEGEESDDLGLEALRALIEK